MSGNQVDRFDYMVDEGDMSDFLDDTDGEYYGGEYYGGEYYGLGGGHDTSPDDYDMVSYMLFTQLLC